jgi:glycosyltransferase involved in cell wall biosynthesis
MSISDVQVALLVPARNESEVISPTLEIMLEAVQRGVVSQAVVLNSGSTDNTAQVVREARNKCVPFRCVCFSRRRLRTNQR